MKKLLLFVFFILVALNIFLASWYVLNQDLHFTTEIARDFFLLQEIDQKKLVLIGPSSSTGLFHGPLWSYLNYPAYKIGGGNPLIVGWWWIILIILFVISNFYIAKRLFNTTTAYLFVLMTSLYMVFHAHDFFNPHGAMLLIPSFFYFFIEYIKKYKIKLLLIHLFIASCIIQFQMAIGIPLVILSFAYICFISIKEKRPLHILCFALVAFLLSNFVIFDLRHQFIISHLLFHFLSSGGRSHLSLFSLIQNRVELMFTGMEIIRRDPGGRNLFLFIMLLFFLVLQLKDKKYKVVYFSFLYFFVGFFVLSLLNVGGPLLYFYLFPLFPLIFLIFSSFVTSRYKIVFLGIFFLVYFMNLLNAFNDISNANKLLIGKDIYSWKFLHNAASQIYRGNDKEFGYFVYSPNVVAFEGKYAMWYTGKEFTEKNASYFTKKPVTYMLIAPPPPNNPFMKDEWWRINQVHITASPAATITFSNGYKIEKYILDNEEIKVPFDTGIDPGIHFR